MARPVQEAPARRSYTVAKAGWIAGRRRAEGDVLELTDSEARYEPLLTPTSDGSAKKGGKSA